MIYFLIGFIACGKTTLGKQLSGRMDYPFIDLDQFIFEQTGKWPVDWFKDEGEDGFRAVEAKVLRTIPEQGSALIVACGGGTPCFHNNLEWMNETGETFYLRLPAVEIFKRLSSQDIEQRPILKDVPGTELQDFLRELLRQREKFYLRATKMFPEENVNPLYVSKYIEPI